MGQVLCRDEGPAPESWLLEACAEERRGGLPCGGALRWAVRLSTWRLNGASPLARSREFEWLRSALIEEPRERDRVLEFRFEADQRRALLARLLARRCCGEALGAPATIGRTAGGKPFVAAVATTRGSGGHRFANFNFNVSHEGDFVVLACEPLALCGVDVCCADRLRGGGREEGGRAPPSLEDLGQYAVAFARDEWLGLCLLGDAERRFDHFRVLWSCKEAYVKARGDGLAFDLSRVTFAALARGDRGPFAAAAVVVDGVRDDRWRVDVESLDDDHFASVCRGPVSEMRDADGNFFATMRAPDAGAVLSRAWRRALAEPRAPFSVLDVDDLVPEDRRPDHAAVRSVGDGPWGLGALPTSSGHPRRPDGP